VSDHWYEDETGPLVRPYTATGGRTRPAAEHSIDLMSQVTAVDPTGSEPRLDHALSSLLELVRREPRPVAEIAADADLPLTVVRVLLADLVEAGLIRVSAPVTHEGLNDPELLREIVDRLREL
jgi:DNA-binding transcriptional ArsR family regulator